MEINPKSDAFIYLYPNTNKANLFLYDPETKQSQQLTALEQEIFDYTVSPDGDFLFYTVLDPKGGSELRKLTISTLKDQLLLNCGSFFCFHPVFSEKNQVILLHKISPPLFNGMENENTELWAYDLETTDFRTFNGENQFFGVYPKWNSDETVVAIQQLNPEKIMMYNPAGEMITAFESNVIEGGYAWKPGSSELYFLNEEINDDQPFTYLWSYDLLNAEFQQKKIDELPEGVLIINIKFSPQGSQWIAGIRESAFLSSQVLWIMGAEDDRLISVIGDNSKIYSNVQWSAAGDKILFQNFQLDMEQSGTAVILWDLNTNQQEVFLADAWFPRFR